MGGGGKGSGRTAFAYDEAEIDAHIEGLLAARDESGEPTSSSYSSVQFRVPFTGVLVLPDWLSELGCRRPRHQLPERLFDVADRLDAAAGEQLCEICRLLAHLVRQEARVRYTLKATGTLLGMARIRPTTDTVLVSIARTRPEEKAVYSRLPSRRWILRILT